MGTWAQEHRGPAAPPPSQPAPTWNRWLLLGLGIFSSHFWFSLERQQGGDRCPRPQGSCLVLMYRGETKAQGEDSFDQGPTGCELQSREWRKSAVGSLASSGALGSALPHLGVALPVPVDSTEAQGHEQDQGADDQDERQDPHGQHFQAARRKKEH